MKTYRVCVWETVGGYVDIEVDDNMTEEEVAQQVYDMVDMDGAYEILHDVTHREVDTCGVDVL